MDAAIIQAPASTKNKERQRDLEMHQTKKGNQWYFGMKAPIGVDADSGLVHTVTSTAANTADVTEVRNLLRGDEEAVLGDAGYIGADKHAPKAERAWYVAEKRSKVKAIKDERLRELLEHYEHVKASIRSKMKHPFRVVKRQFGFRKVRYRGLAKNGAQVTTKLIFSTVSRLTARFACQRS